MRLLPPLLILLPALAFAQAAPPAGQAILTALGGTGFIVNKRGDIVTNAHVVQHCRAITVTTSRGEQPADLITADSTQDLALLRIPATAAPAIAPMRFDTSALTIGDPVIIIGYPGHEGLEGRGRFAKTVITKLSGPAGEGGWLQLAIVTEKGYSGGPVLDMAGNVIGVVTAMALQFREDEVNQPDAKPVAQAALVITLPILERFLKANAIPYHRASPRRNIKSDETLVTQAHPFIVPVRCILGRSTTAQ